ncbi:MAG: beta-lactamase family protein [Solirubrobacteraceae bacterium]|nr:beta-lactamase family protein [Solirubrobacteraceae bacterium]
MLAATVLAALPAVAGAQVAGGPTTPTTPTVPTITTPAPTPTTPTGPPTVAPTPPDPTGAPPVQQPPGPGSMLGETPIDVPVLTARMEADLKKNGGVVGYGWSVHRNGQTVSEGGSGKRRIKADGDRSFGASTRMEIMSSTKPVTALALLKVYDRTNLSQGGAVKQLKAGTRQNCGGHAGLHMSPRDLAQLFSVVRSSTTVLPAAVRQEMFDGRLGWKSSSNKAGTDSAGLWWHGGDGYFGGDREVHTCILNGTQGYSVALTINSQRPGKSQCAIVKDAFNAARGE